MSDLGKQVIRLAELPDIERICSLSAEEYGGSLDDYRKSCELEINENSNDGSLSKIFVVLRDNTIIALSRLFYYKSEKIPVDYESPLGFYFNGIIVDSKFRRQGVARALTKFRLELIEEMSGLQEAYSIVASDNAASISYHESLGFTEVRRAKGFLKVKLKCGEGILFRYALT